jgi:hypothetical protein
VLGTALGELGMGCTAHDLITTQAVGMTLTLMSNEVAEDRHHGHPEAWRCPRGLRCPPSAAASELQPRVIAMPP